MLDKDIVGLKCSAEALESSLNPFSSFRIFLLSQLDSLHLSALVGHNLNFPGLLLLAWGPGLASAIGGSARGLPGGAVCCPRRHR